MLRTHYLAVARTKLFKQCWWFGRLTVLPFIQHWRSQYNPLEHKRSSDGNILCILWNQKICYWLTTAYCLCLFWSKWIKSTPSHTLLLRSILILSFHLYLGLPSSFLLSGFSIQNHIYTFPSFPIHPTCRLRPNYLTQHHILEQPWDMFLPECERPSFTLIQTYTWKRPTRCTFISLTL